MGARGFLSPWILGNPRLLGHGSDQLRSARPVGTLLGLTPSPLLAFFRSLLPLIPTLLPGPIKGLSPEAFIPVTAWVVVGKFRS